MHVQDFMRAIESGEPRLVYLFCPARPPRAKAPSFEPFFAEQAVARFVQRFVDPAMKDLAYAAYYADETDPGEIVLEARSVPFLVPRRVVLVRNAERYFTESNAEPVLGYLEAPSDTAVLLFVAAGLDKRTKFYKACEKAGEIVECPELKERQAIQWVRDTVEALGKTIAPGAAREIVARAGTHLSDLNNAVTNVADFVGDRPVISEDDVVAACADVAEEEVWALTDAIAASNLGAALEALRRLTDMGKREDELMGIINWLLKSAYAVAVADKHGPRISPFVAKKVAPLANKLGVKRIRDAFVLCTDTHYLIRSTGVNGPLALELLVVKLAAPAQRREPA